MSFTGFTQKEFDIFDLPDFKVRMPTLKQEITPKLKNLGEDLLARVEISLDQPLFLHVAQHLRRTVNPPEETWVAFSPAQRAYKPFVHIRAAIRGECMRILVFCEDYAEDKPIFANCLLHNAANLSKYCADHPEIVNYDLKDDTGKPLSGLNITPDKLTLLSERLNKYKGQHAAFGIELQRDLTIMRSGKKLVDEILRSIDVLKPFYLCGTSPSYEFEYIPNV